MTRTAFADRRLHPLSMIVAWVREVPQTVIGIPAVIAFTSNAGIGPAILLGLAFAGLNLLFAWMRWSRFRFGLGSGELVIESGLFSKSRRTIPFSRIQDVDIERSLTHRVLGLARVRVETGGSARDEGKLDALSMEDAEALRLAIRGQHVAVAQSAEISPVATEGNTIVAMPLSEVIKEGVFSFSFRSIAIIFGSLSYFASQILEDAVDSDQIVAAAAASRVGENFSWIWLGFVIALPVLALITSVGHIVMRDFGFRLTAEAKGLRRTRGLFTKSDVLIPRRRVQLGLLRSGPIWDRIGRSAMFVQTMGGDTKGGPPQVLPFAQAAEVNAALRELPVLDAERPALDRVSSYHPLLQMMRRIFWPVAAFPIVVYFQPYVAVLGAFLLLIGGMTWLSGRRHRYAMAGDMLFVDQGWWRRKRWRVPLSNARNVSIRQGPVQRRFGVVTLLIDTAGGSLRADPSVVDIDRETAETLIASIKPHLRKVQAPG